MGPVSNILARNYFVDLSGTDLAYSTGRELASWELRVREDEALVAFIEKKLEERSQRRTKGRFK